jgi:hypothetical protein
MIGHGEPTHNNRSICNRGHACVTADKVVHTRVLLIWPEALALVTATASPPTLPSMACTERLRDDFSTPPSVTLAFDRCTISKLCATINGWHAINGSHRRKYALEENINELTCIFHIVHNKFNIML